MSLSSSDIDSSSPSCFSSSSSISSLSSSPASTPGNIPSDTTNKSTASTHNIDNPTTLQNLSECKSFFVEALVDAAAYLVEAMWAFSTEDACFVHQSLPLKRFIQEILRRSRTSYSTLQLALYYLVLIKPYVYKTRQENRRLGNHTIPKGQSPALRCGRRTFLAALMLASKYSQDRNYSVAAWSKISGLGISELRANEVKFLDAVEWNLFVAYDIYERWSQVLFECACEPVTAFDLPVSTEANSCGHVHNQAQDQKRLVWLERFTLINTSITNCNWFKQKSLFVQSLSLLPSSSCSAAQSSLDLNANSSKIQNSGSRQRCKQLVTIPSKVLRPITSNNRVDKPSSSSNLCTSRRQLGTLPQTPNTHAPKYPSKLNTRKLSVQLLSDSDSDSQQVIINDSYLVKSC